MTQLHIDIWIGIATIWLMLLTFMWKTDTLVNVVFKTIMTLLVISGVGIMFQRIFG